MQKMYVPRTIKVPSVENPEYVMGSLSREPIDVKGPLHREPWAIILSKVPSAEIAELSLRQRSPPQRSQSYHCSSYLFYLNENVGAIHEMYMHK